MAAPPLILGNSAKRFSGVTSTMLQTLPEVRKLMPLAILGDHHLSTDTPVLTFRQLIGLRDRTRIFHARRNNEMIQALAARRLGAKLKIVFTSTAQRHHSRFTRWLMSKMDAILTTCNAANSYLKKPADIIIPHGIDTKTYTPSDRTKSDQINIGVFGRIRPSKGIDLLIDAAIPVLKNYPHATLNICGETTPKFQDYLDEQKAKISAASLTAQVKFLGKVEFGALPSLYRSMDIVCAVSRNEGYGLTPLEAMASGVAVLTSEAGAWKDIVENGVQGYCVPTGNIKAIQEKLEFMVNDPAKLAEMGKAGRKHVEKHYTNEREARLLCKFFRDLMLSD
jgi:mannosyltransferase